MKTVSDDIMNLLRAAETQWVFCAKITRKDGMVTGFTSHDETLVIDDVTYHANHGMVFNALAQSANLENANSQAAAPTGTNGIDPADVRNGLYNFAEVRIFRVSFENPEAGTIPVQRFWISNLVQKDERQFGCDLQGLSSRYDAQIISQTSLECRYDFGSQNTDAGTGCTLDALDFTFTGTVTTGSTDGSTFSDTGRTEADKYFQYGLLTWTGGANEGLQMEVKTYTQSGGAFVLFQPMASAISVGDTYECVAGCDKLLDTCCHKFNNAINFGGEPYIPGTSVILQTPNAK